MYQRTDRASSERSQSIKERRGGRVDSVAGDTTVLTAAPSRSTPRRSLTALSRTGSRRHRASTQRAARTWRGRRRARARRFFSLSTVTPSCQRPRARDLERPVRSPTRPQPLGVLQRPGGSAISLLEKERLCTRSRASGRSERREKKVRVAVCLSRPWRRGNS